MAAQKTDAASVETEQKGAQVQPEVQVVSEPSGTEIRVTKDTDLSTLSPDELFDAFVDAQANQKNYPKALVLDMGLELARRRAAEKEQAGEGAMVVREALRMSWATEAYGGDVAEIGDTLYVSIELPNTAEMRTYFTEARAKIADLEDAAKGLDAAQRAYDSEVEAIDARYRLVMAGATEANRAMLQTLADNAKEAEINAAKATLGKAELEQKRAADDYERLSPLGSAISQGLGHKPVVKKISKEKNGSGGRARVQITEYGWLVYSGPLSGHALVVDATNEWRLYTDTTRQTLAASSETHPYTMSSPSKAASFVVAFSKGEDEFKNVVASGRWPSVNGYSYLKPVIKETLQSIP